MSPNSPGLCRSDIEGSSEGYRILTRGPFDLLQAREFSAVVLYNDEMSRPVSLVIGYNPQFVA